MAITTHGHTEANQLSPGVPYGSRPATTTGHSNRIHYLDNLRAVAMLLGVFLHSALAYAQPSQQIWLATDTRSSVAIDASIWLIHLFRMGLFYLLSGYFAKLVIERKGTRQFLANRSLRLVLPFVVFYPFLLVAMGLVIQFSLSYIENPRGLMGFIARAIENSDGAPKRQAPGTMHLWFVYYLLGFTIVGLMLSKVKGLNLSWLMNRPRWIWLCPLLLIPGAIAGGTPLAAPESFIPHWWPFAFYGLYYLAGWQLFGREHLLDACRPYWGYLLAAGALLYVPFYWLMPVLDFTVLNPSSMQSIWVRGIEGFLTAYLSALWTINALLLGQRFLAHRSSLLSFIADSSYWVYLLHLPIVIFLQSLLVPLNAPWWIKIAVVLTGTMLACISTYLVFVRYTPVGWMLHGKRSFP